MSIHSLFSRARQAVAVLLVLGLAAGAGTALADPPGRVARVGYLSGQVSFQPAGDDRWAEVALNRPLVTGDRLYTDRGSRTEMDIGAATIRLDERSTFTLLNLDDDLAQLELTEGVMHLRVFSVSNGQSYEVDTPTLAFVVNRPGSYRIDIDPNGESSMVTVFEGGGDVYGEDNASYSVQAGSSYRFHDSALRDYEVLDLPRRDDFDRWVDARDTRYTRSVSRNYVSSDTIGYADLDEYGSWSSVPQYGQVWYPTRVSAGWAPYRSGHWSWIDPWGWTWVDNNPWGFAPFHYGRWAYVGNRWGWCPGPRHVRAVYAPALVAFVGGNGWGVSINAGGPVGWFPLGPRDVYVPWYRASRGYFNNINVRNTTVINNINITNVYNNYSAGRPINNVDYAYRRNASALTAVPRDAFIAGRPVANARVRVDEARLRSAEVVSRVAVAPTRDSFVAGRVRSAPAEATRSFDRRVVARTAPPARAVPSTRARVEAIQRNNAQPLAREQLRELAQRPGSAATNRRAPAERVSVVGQGAREPKPLPNRSSATRQRGDADGQRAPQQRTTPADRERIMPTGGERAPAARQPATDRASGNPTRERAAGSNREAVPSSRFAPRGERSTPAREARDATPRGNAQPRGESRTTPAERARPEARASGNDRAAREPTQRPQPRSESRSAPAQRAQPQPRESRSVQAPREASQRSQPRNAPQQRNAPAQRETRQPRAESRSAPVQRSAPAPRQEPQRSAPVQRSEPRSAPAQRQAPQPRSEPRSAPQQRSAPQPRSEPQQRSAPQPRSEPQQRSAPAQRSEPQRRGRNSDKDDDDRRR